jgi:hypothetical protein
MRVSRKIERTGRVVRGIFFGFRTRGTRRRRIAAQSLGDPGGAANMINREEDMSFKNVGPPTLLYPGGTAYWWYGWGNDHGPQLAEADIKTPNLGAVHEASDQRLKKDNSGATTYYVNIANQGPGPCWHNLMGGGLS